MATIYTTPSKQRIVIGFDQHAGRWWTGEGRTAREAIGNIAPRSYLDPDLSHDEARDASVGCDPANCRSEAQRVEILTRRDGDHQDVVQYI